MRMCTLSTNSTGFYGGLYAIFPHYFFTINLVVLYNTPKQEAQLTLTTGSTRLEVSRGQQTWYHSTCYI